MTDQECVQFLRWVLPRLHMRWAGFRKVRRQVCKRFQRRLQVLGLPTLSTYRDYLEHTPSEWRVADELCRITISRFYRDREVFDRLCGPVLRLLAATAERSGRRRLTAWSIGCGCGEEPYTLAIATRLAPAPASKVDLSILATDVDSTLLARARAARYRRSSLKDLPPAWLEQAFDLTPSGYCLRAPYGTAVRWELQDIRTTLPTGHFDLILCRNMAFTNFDDQLQGDILARLLAILEPGGVLVV
ncbi:MAG: CheR family methyltransferase, partial [Acidiferrobacterales bacterium]